MHGGAAGSVVAEQQSDHVSSEVDLVLLPQQSRRQGRRAAQVDTMTARAT